MSSGNVQYECANIVRIFTTFLTLYTNAPMDRDRYDTAGGGTPKGPGLGFPNGLVAPPGAAGAGLLSDCSCSRFSRAAAIADIFGAATAGGADIFGAGMAGCGIAAGWVLLGDTGAG